MTRHILKLIWNRKRTNFLMMAEILVSFLVLFAVASLAVYTADNWRRPRGFSIDDVWDVSIDMKQANEDTATAAQQQTITQLSTALKNMPEIVTSGGSMLAPYQMGSSSSRYGWRGRTIDFGVAEVTDGFKDVLGLTIVEGRWFGPQDDGQTYRAIVINENMRRDLFGAGPALGQVLNPEHRPEERNYREQRVVGVIADYREDGEFDGTRNYAIYRTGPQDRPPQHFLVKVRPGTPAEFEERLTRQLTAVAPDWSFEVTPLDEMRSSFNRFAFMPLIAIGLVAGFLMLMVALGLLGVLWQNVTQRTREIGLRRAKGAPRESVRRQILGEIAVMTSLAVIVGVVIAVQLPLLDVIYFVEPHVYVISLAMTVSAIYVLTLTCGWYPSRMATLVEPADALRYE